jgi:hypothetical protein
MNKETSLYYDEEGDVSSSYFDNLCKGVFKVIDKSAGETKGIAVFEFKARTKNLDEIKLSLPFELKFN